MTKLPPNFNGRTADTCFCQEMCSQRQQEQNAAANKKTTPCNSWSVIPQKGFQHPPDVTLRCACSWHAPHLDSDQNDADMLAPNVASLITMTTAVLMLSKLVLLMDPDVTL